jgi:hypothetical protein
LSDQPIDHHETDRLLGHIMPPAGLCRVYGESASVPVGRFRGSGEVGIILLVSPGRQ